MDWRYNTIWFDQIDASKVAQISFKEPIPENFGDLEYITFWRYRSPTKSLDWLPASKTALYLSLNLGGTKSLEGVGHLSSLRRLEVEYCMKLESDRGLSAVAETLRHLHVNTCSKFKMGSDLLSLKRLEVLRLNKCGDIEDLDFLHNFPNLMDFRFVNTNIKSGDLSPLLAHKTLRSVGFLNKRRYNLKKEAVDAGLAAKWPVSNKEIATKGQWRTFKYIGAEL
jgi:hypothetical protein